MAPSRGRGRGRAPPAPARRTTVTAASAPALARAPAHVYQDMLDEAAVVDPAGEPLSHRPLKRRRLLRGVRIPSGSPSAVESASESEAATRLQTAQRSSDDEDESDLGFEDVDLGTSSTATEPQDERMGDISVPLHQHPTPQRKMPSKRKPATAVEKAHRLLVHKAHVLCLLSHCIRVNSWINAVAADDSIAPKLAGNARTFFKVRQGAGQFEQNKTFLRALQKVVEHFTARYAVTSSGMRRGQWDASADDTADIDPVDKDDFFRAARKMEGSQDMGNQLFCALLRSIGVEARMVCSLQPLPFASPPTKSATPQKVVKRTVYAIASDTDPDKRDVSADDTAITTSKTIGRVPSARRRLGMPTFFPAANIPDTPAQPKKAVRMLSYPIFWVEAFNEAHQMWLPVDPIVTGAINKAPTLEPPGSYEQNQLSYAIAFEANCVAKDVTRRYAKAYNAKTRRQRVERTGDQGHWWWKKTMRFFHRRGGHSDQDQVEDAELTQKEAKEGMPANIQDFKDHPVYALERHLKRHEVIHPRREVGKANAGTAKNARMEAVFRRRDVLLCQSADKWYRSGRVIKAGEQPRKHLASAARRRRTPTDDEDEEVETERRTALYSLDQTDIYIPPPVSASGQIPRNAFGNLDIYVPSMVPAGGIHIRHPLTIQAAQILKIDAVDAVVGFSFRGRQGTAIIEGAVIADRYAGAVRAVIEGLEWEAEEERGLQRSLVALKLWKRFLVGLKIKERVAAYGPGEKKDERGGAEEQDFVEDPAVSLLGGSDGGEREEQLMCAGRYEVEELVEMLGEAKRARKRAVNRGRGTKRVEDDRDEDEFETGSIAHDDGEVGDGGFMAEDAEMPMHKTYMGRGGFEVKDDDGGGGGGGGEGGFAAEDRYTGDAGGGFVLDDETIDSDGGDGGGFVVDDENDDGAAQEWSGDFVLKTRDAPQHSGGDGSQNAGPDDGGGSAPDEQNEPPTPRAAAHDGDSDVVMHGAVPDTFSGNPTLSSAGEPLLHTGTSNDASSSPPARQPVTEPQGDGERAGPEGGGGGGVAETEQADEADDGSLLSHDPEDDDAEPDWLESD